MESNLYFPPENETVKAEALPQHLQNALRDLLRQFEATCDIARREYVRNVLKNHELFRGNAWRWFDYQTGTWRAYNSMSGGMTTVAGGVDAQSLYTLNFFQGYALSLIALLSGNKMVVKFWPQNSRKPEDVEAAKKHDAVIKWFRTHEKTHSQLVKAIYLMWTDGSFGSYVRTVADGDRFGWRTEPQIEIQERQISPPMYTCPVCGTVNEGAVGCVNCGAPLPIEPDIPPQMANVPVQIGEKQVPLARTLREIVGGLELLVPPTANEIHEFPYLIRRREMDKSTVRATYPELADKIGAPGGIQVGDTATSTIEKRARLQTLHGLTADRRPVPVRSSEYVTVTEIWFAKKAFYQLDDARQREELLQAFPDGAYVAFADDVLCEARNENMLDHWRVCHALPGNGQIREPIAGSLVQVQEIANDLVNIIRDIIEYTMPTTFIDSQVIDLKKWARSSVMAGSAYPAKAPPGQPLGNGFYQTEPGRLPEYAVGFLNDLRNSIAQFVTGVFPAAYGAHSSGNNLIDVGEVIPTPSGFVRNGDLKDGDQIFGEDGKTYTVLKAHPEKDEVAYRVTFDDGTSVLAHDGHRWFTLTSKEREAAFNRTEERLEYQRKYRRKKNGQDPDAPKGRTAPKPKKFQPGKIRTTQEIMDTLLDKRGRSNHAVPVAAPFEAAEADLLIDPYVLGVWLGDGAAAGGVIACSDEDGPSIAREFAAAGFELKRLKTPYTWYAKGLRSKLGKLGLLGEKKIPEGYLWASPRQRLALLQGLMDTDGCATTDGKQFFTNCDRGLVDGVYHLAASLGCKPRILESITGPVVNGKSGKVYPGGRPIWTVRWTNPLNVFRLARKASRVKTDTKASRRNYRHIISVERVGAARMRCITTSNPSTLFLFGKNFNCTGNTAQGMDIERNSALGRVSLFLRALTEHWAEVAELVVKDFKKNGTDPINVVSVDQSGGYKTETLTPNDLEIGSAHTYPELDEDYPTTWPQKQALLMQLMGNPLFQPMLTMMSNADIIKKTLGHELQVPGEAQYRRAFKVMQQLLASEPIPQPPQPSIDPMTGAPVIDPMTGQVAMQPMPPLPSVQPDLLDDAGINITAAVDFAFSEEGELARQANPMGWQNLVLWAEANHAKLISGQGNPLAMPPPMPGQGQAPPQQGG